MLIVYLKLKGKIIKSNKKEGRTYDFMILKRMRLYVEPTHITNCYIIADENLKEAMVIDPGAQAEEVINMINILDVKVKYIVLTHCHADHIGAVSEIKNELGGKLLIHRDEAEGLFNPEINLEDIIGNKKNVIEVDARVDHGDIIHIGDIQFRIIHTPGHTKGSICLYCEKEKMLFSGDTLFRGTWGRTDLPTGSLIQIMSSITNKLLILPEDTIIYPGHGKSSMIKDEEPIYFNLQPRKL